MRSSKRYGAERRSSHAFISASFSFCLTRHAALVSAIAYCAGVIGGVPSGDAHPIDGSKPMPRGSKPIGPYCCCCAIMSCIGLRMSCIGLRMSCIGLRMSIGLGVWPTTDGWAFLALYAALALAAAICASPIMGDASPQPKPRSSNRLSNCCDGGP